MQEQLRQDNIVLDPELSFADDGYSGATLVRPALEQLLDMAALGLIDRLYVHSPDRLARKYAYQVLLLEELHRCGMEVVFLNHTLSDNPEGQLLLQVQGMVTEYERARMMERCQGGKLDAARHGSVNVLDAAPYGYRYISARVTDGHAAYEIFLEQARVVRQVFAWVGRGPALDLGSLPKAAESGPSYGDRTIQVGSVDRLWHVTESRLQRNGRLRQDPQRANATPPMTTTRRSRAASVGLLDLR